MILPVTLYECLFTYVYVYIYMHIFIYFFAYNSSMTNTITNDTIISCLLLLRLIRLSLLKKKVSVLWWSLWLAFLLLSVSFVYLFNYFVIPYFSDFHHHASLCLKSWQLDCIIRINSNDMLKSSSTLILLW